MSRINFKTDSKLEYFPTSVCNNYETFIEFFLTHYRIPKLSSWWCWHMSPAIIITSSYLRGHKRDKVTFLRGLWLVSTGHKPPLLPRKPPTMSKYSLRKLREKKNPKLEMPPLADG